MKAKVILIILGLILAGGLVAAYFAVLQMQDKGVLPKFVREGEKETTMSVPASVPIDVGSVVVPATEVGESEAGEEEVGAEDLAVFVEWLVYKNEEYGFEMSYPETYALLDDEENLYGWENSLALFFVGGQAYDISVEVWDSEEEYETAHANESLVVEKIGSKYIVVVDLSNRPENADVLKTFRISDVAGE
jgi:hypothetical protein